jgi:DNA-binding response OmpR family regulator
MSLKKRRPLAELPGGAETILVVDDDNTVRALIRETLKIKGYGVLDAQFNSGALMVSGRHRGPIHLMIADVMMPGVNGRELGRRLETLRPDTKVVYMSGYPKEMLVDEAILEDTAAFLAKPISPDSLLTKIREVLDFDDPAAPGKTDLDHDDFVLAALQRLLSAKKEYRLSREQATSLESLIIEYEEQRLACEAEFMVAELHVQTLVQDDQASLADIETALRKSEREQIRVRLEGVKTLRATEELLDRGQREKFIASYPHGRRRAGNRLVSL